MENGSETKNILVYKKQKEESRTRSLVFVAPFAHSLLFGDGRGTGGAERQFVLFGKGLKRQGWIVSFITEKSNNECNHNTSEFVCYHADFSYLGGSKVNLPMSWCSLWQAMEKANAHYNVIKVPGHLLAPVSIFCRLRKRKLVFWTQMTFDANPQERGDMNKVASWLQNWGLKRADVVIAQSEDQKKAFKNNYRINAKIVPSICDSLLPDSNAEANLHDPGKEVDILWVGNPKPKKRHEVFFELARLLPQRTFAIAMNNNDAFRFVKAKENAKKLPNVMFLGTVPPIEMETWFRKTKLFLNTSIREGFPNTFLQAWMNEVPVVSLNIDPDDIISSKGLGYVVAKADLPKRNDYLDLARYLVRPVEKILNNDNLQSEIGKRAADYVRKMHAPDIVVPKLINALTEDFK